MTHILIPREPSTALLRPFIGCNTQELHEAWAAMVRIAEGQHARAGSQRPAQIEEPAQPVAEICSASHDDAEFGERAIKPLCDISGFEYGTPLYAGAAPAAAAPQGERQWICPTRTVADLVNNLLTMDQALPIYGAQYIEKDGRRCAIAVPPTVSRERVKDGRWIGQGEELNAAVVWTRAEQPVATPGLTDGQLDDESYRVNDEPGFADAFRAGARFAERVHGVTASAARAVTGKADWWRGRADEIEVRVARSGSQEAMRCYTDMRTLLQAAAPALEAPAAPVRQPLTDERIEPLFRARQQMQVVGEKDEWFWFAWGVADAERAHGITAAAPQAPAAPVAYLDLGAGGYMDLGTDLSEQQLGALPKGRHMLAIIGTHGIDGYAAAPAAPVTPAAAMAALKAAFAADPEYAWSWHCAAWSCAHDEGLATDAANRAAARLMYMAFDCDTSKHPNFLDEHRRAAPAAPAVDASDTALLDAMERERIAVIPEFEGPWDAQIFGEDEATLACGSGATPREAIAEALASLEARKAHDAAQAAAKGGGIVSKTERLGHANALIEIISRHGRRFFRNRESGAIARLELDASGRLWWIDEYRGSRVYTGKVMGYPHRWRGFSHGGTLRSLVEALRGYVLRGELLHPEYIAPSRIDPTNGDIWGYGAEAAAAVRAEAHALPLFQRPTGHKEST